MIVTAYHTALYDSPQIPFSHVADNPGGSSGERIGIQCLEIALGNIPFRRVFQTFKSGQQSFQQSLLAAGMVRCSLRVPAPVYQSFIDETYRS